MQRICLYPPAFNTSKNSGRGRKAQSIMTSPLAPLVYSEMRNTAFDSMGGAKFLFTPDLKMADSSFDAFDVAAASAQPNNHQRSYS